MMHLTAVYDEAACGKAATATAVPVEGKSDRLHCGVMSAQG